MPSPLITFTAHKLDGGIGRNIINLANALLNKNYRVHVLLDNRSGPYLDQLDSEVEIKTFTTSNAVSGLPFSAWYLFKAKPAVVVTPNVRHTVLMLRSRSLLNRKVRVFSNVHNTYSHKYRNLPKRKFSSRISKIQAHYPKCDGIIAVSKGVANDFCTLTGIDPALVTTIYNPVVTDQLLQMAQIPIDHPWFRDDSPPLIISVGRLETAKNFECLIDAFDRLRTKFVSRLVIIGEGSQRKHLQQRIQHSPYQRDIALLGHQNNPYAYMKRATVFVLSSSWEGFGNVLVEAMATGTPVVSSDCPNGPREILDDGRYGMLTPVGDSGALADAIVSTINSPRLKSELQNAVSPYLAETIADRYLELFDID